MGRNKSVKNEMMQLVGLPTAKQFSRISWIFSIHLKKYLCSPKLYLLLCLRLSFCCIRLFSPWIPPVSLAFVTLKVSRTILFDLVLKFLIFIETGCDPDLTKNDEISCNRNKLWFVVSGYELINSRNESVEEQNRNLNNSLNHSI